MQNTLTSDLRVRHVPAAQGFAWWRSSFSWLFGAGARLWTWVLMGVVLDVLCLALRGASFYGSVALTLLWFVFTGGLMRAADNTVRGAPLAFTDLFSGFQARGGALFGVGALVLAVLAGIWLIFMAIGLATVVQNMSNLSIDASPDEMFERFGTSFTVSSYALLGLLACLVLLVALSMAAWLAPALVILGGVSAPRALRLSLVACLRNAGALTLYGLAFLVLALSATILAMLGWFFLVPLMFLSTYAAYRDLFETAVEVLEARPAENA